MTNATINAASKTITRTYTLYGCMTPRGAWSASESKFMREGFPNCITWSKDKSEWVQYSDGSRKMIRSSIMD